MVKHTGERPHICEFCKASFAQKGNLRNHIRRVHTLLTVDGSDLVHRCRWCTCVFRKLGSLNAHMSRAHASSFNSSNDNSQPTSNVQEEAVVDDLLALSKDLEISKTDMSKEIESGKPSILKDIEITKISTENIKNVIPEDSINADILQQALENSGLATREEKGDRKKPYIMTVSDAKPYVMTVSDAITGDIKTHIMRNVDGVRYYQCVYCVKEFKKPSDLVRHIRIHTHEKPYKCIQCFRSFAVKSSLNAHLKTHLGTKDFSCVHCQKLFSTSGSLKVHLLLHTGDKPYTCSVCDKAFRTTGHRSSHMNTHFSEKNSIQGVKTVLAKNPVGVTIPNISLQEPILITDVGFMQQAPKNTYQQMLDSAYPSIRPYRCSICQKGFKKSSHLKQHIRSHTGEKPYECTVCHRCFVSNGVLKSHLKTHTGVKGYTCEICDASFTTNGSLKRHMCIHRDDRPYMCPFCQKTFKSSMNCKKHMKTHRYEAALGMASGVTVTVISDGNVISSGNVKDAPKIMHKLENTNLPVVDNSDAQPILSLGADSEQKTAGNVSV